MRRTLYFVMDMIARAHNKLLSLNDAFEYGFSDKQLHFLVIGLLGMLLLTAVHPLFLYLSKKGHVLAISWIYVFTLIAGLTLAIEIGQKISSSGSMEFADIVFGVFGFLAMFSVYAIIRWLVISIARTAKKKRANYTENGDKP